MQACKPKIDTFVKLNVTHILVLMLIFIAGCFSNDRNALNERNSFYVKAEKLKEEGKFGNAVEAFSQCLRYSPDSYKAHLQLAMIFEDNLGDLPQAVVHYQHYIKKSPEKDQISVVQKWLQRVGEKYYNSLKMKYRGKDAITESEEEQERVDKKEVLHQQSVEENKESFYVVKPGETLNQIAKDFFGDYKYWSLLYEANKHMLSSPEQLHVGQRLVLPQVDSFRHHD